MHTMTTVEKPSSSKRKFVFEYTCRHLYEEFAPHVILNASKLRHYGKELTCLLLRFIFLFEDISRSVTNINSTLYTLL